MPLLLSSKKQLCKRDNVSTQRATAISIYNLTFEFVGFMSLNFIAYLMFSTK